MLKKAALLATVVGALVALTAPAVAQADELVRFSNGEHLEIGQVVMAESTDVEYVDPFGTHECAGVTLLGYVAENGPAVEIDEKESRLEECNGGPETLKVDPITLGGESPFGQGFAPMSYMWFGICEMSGIVPFAYEYGSNELTITGEDQLQSNQCTPQTWRGSFHLTLENGARVNIVE
jgi:hypothetical protein